MLGEGDKVSIRRHERSFFLETYLFLCQEIEFEFFDLVIGRKPLQVRFLVLK
jgi:hypothetical protein